MKTKAKPPKPEIRYAALIEGSGRYEGQILIRKRPETGLLARMWELPHVLAAQQAGKGSASLEEAMDQVRDMLFQEGIHAEPVEAYCDAEHTFSHIHWQMRVYRCKVLSESSLPPGYAFIERDHMEGYAFPNLFLKLIQGYFDERMIGVHGK